MKFKHKYDSTKTSMLANARRKASLSQAHAARYFGIGRGDSVGAWELGYSRPPEIARRERFISYLLDELSLYRDLARFERIWEDVAVGEWGWDPLDEAEQTRFLPPAPELEPKSPDLEPEYFSENLPSPFQLPPKLVGVIPRKNIWSDLESLLWPGAEHEVRLVSLVGPAGSGKSVLAKQAAYEWGDRFRDGVIWVDLRGQKEAAPILRQIAAAHGHRREADRATGDEELAAIVRSILHQLETLVILDNAEVLPSDEFPYLLPSSGKSLTLITSRRLFSELRLHGRVLHVDVMSDAEARSLITHILGESPDDDEETARVTLAERLGRLPLALSIAALNIANRSWDTRFYLTRLRLAPNLVAALSLPREEGPQFNVQQAFGISYEVLEDEQKILFRSLGAMAEGGFTPEILSGVLSSDPNDVEKQLDELAVLSLVQLRGKPCRYDLHPLLADYSRMLASKADEWRKWASAHSKYFSAQAKVHTHDYSWLETELANLMAAAEWSLKHDQGDDILDMVEWLYAGGGRFFAMQGHSEDAAKLLKWAVEVAEHRGDSALQAKHLRFLGVVLKQRGLNAEALVKLEAALDIQQRMEDEAEIASCLNDIGVIMSISGETDQAMERFKTALDLRRKLEDASGIADCLMNMGIEQTWRHEFEATQANLEEAASAFKDLEDRQKLAMCYLNMGNNYLEQENSQKAIKDYHRSLLISTEIGDLEGEALCHYQMALALMEQQNYSGALGHLRESLEIARKMGDLSSEAHTLGAIGEAYGYLDDEQNALQYLRQALAMSQELGYGPLEEECIRLISAVEGREDCS